MKVDEFWLLHQLQTSSYKTPRELIDRGDFPINKKRAYYLLEKWVDKGWYEYGVCIDLGWLTELGKSIWLLKVN